MATVYYITGGERSGKSSYAQKLAEELSDSPYYLATSRIWDEDFQERVDRHVSGRGDVWQTIEEEKYLSRVDVEGKTLLVDCVTLWLTNWFSDTNGDVELCLESAKGELEKLFETEAKLVIISNEIGMGGHAPTHVGRKFTELQGWVNQFIAARSDHAVMMVSGLPLKLK